jgi:hypothetical protein
MVPVISTIAMALACVVAATAKARSNTWPVSLLVGYASGLAVEIVLLIVTGTKLG